MQQLRQRLAALGYQGPATNPQRWASVRRRRSPASPHGGGVSHNRGYCRRQPRQRATRIVPDIAAAVRFRLTSTAIAEQTTEWLR